MAGLVAVSGVVFAGVILGAITMWSHNRQIQEAGKRSDAVVTAEALDVGDGSIEGNSAVQTRTNLKKMGSLLTLEVQKTEEKTRQEIKVDL
ncbi:MAG: hypothetical protein V8S42_01905 [Lachnospiraceae bacterium]